VALRIPAETYETAALPLSYVGASASIGDEFKIELFEPGQSEREEADFASHGA